MLKIVNVNIAKLKPAEYNPRIWDKKAVNDLTESIKRFGIVDPIICNSAENRKNVVVGGHFRLHVAKKLGYKEMPVVYVNIPEAEKEKELNLRLNKNSGEFDFDLLKSFNHDLLLDVGFSSTELSDIVGKINGIADDDKEELKPTPKVKPGDIYQLGKHRLMCGDSTDTDQVAKLMGSERANIVYSDMPYNIGLDYDKGFGKKSKYGGSTNDSKSEKVYTAFVLATITNAYSYAKLDSHFFWYCDENYIWLVQEVYQKLGIRHKRVCVWVKNSANPTPNTAFNKSFEMCIYGTLGDPYLSPLYNLNGVLNPEIETGNDSIEQIEKITNLWAEKRLPTSEYEHPTEKSPSLHTKPIRRCSRMGDLVLDLFAGSGSTLIACEKLDRRCYTMEIEPTFCDLVIARYEKLTGRKAILVGNYHGTK